MQCYPIVLFQNRQCSFVGVCFDPKDISIVANQNRNVRWLNEGKDLSFNEWCLNDKSDYRLLKEIPFHGNTKMQECNLLVNYEEIIGAYITEEDFFSLVDEYNMIRWKNWVYRIYEKENSLNYKVLNYKTFMDIYPLNLTLISSVKVHIF